MPVRRLVPHFFSKLRRAACWLLFFSWTNLVYAADFSFIYIEPGEGDSSGGHAAIQFGDDVYHFQHDSSGLIRLKRQKSAAFQFSYQYLQNRPLHLAHIALSTTSYKVLLEQFKTMFWVQQRQFAQLEQLQYDQSLLLRFLHIQRHQPYADIPENAAIRLKGAGLFFNDHDVFLTGIPKPPPHQSAPITQLRSAIEQHYGKSYLQQRLAEINAAIKYLAIDNWQQTRWPLLSAKKYPPESYAASDAYRDLSIARLAIYTLQQARPLLPDARFILASEEFRLSIAEENQLKITRQHLQQNILSLPASGRPDWGYALLVSLARWAAVTQSLDLHRWVFVDDFADQSTPIETEEAVRHTSEIKTLSLDALQNLRQARQQLSNQQQYSESRYSGLEIAANRYNELSQTQHLIRFNGESPLPVKSIRLPLSPIPDVSEQAINAALTHLDNYRHQLLKELEQPYAYNLISRNCVTELFHTLYQTFDQQSLATSKPQTNKQQTIAEHLGGVVDEHTFIPFLAYDAILDSYRVHSKQTFPSYRQQQLMQQTHAENPLLLAVRETNTLSSTLYRYNPDDAFFIFFTDRHWLLRPLFGAVNTSAGIGQILTGILTLPFDDGKNLASGISGMLVSLPELVFLNIRKGSYRYLSFNQFTSQNLAKIH